MHPVWARESGAPGARNTLVTGESWITEVRATRTLKQVAADCCNIAQLLRGTEQECLRDQRIAVTDNWLVCHLVHRRQSTNAHTAVRHLNASQGKPCDIDKKVGCEDVVFHQIKQCRATRNVPGLGVSRKECDGCFHFFCKRIAKRLHWSFPLERYR